MTEKHKNSDAGATEEVKDYPDEACSKAWNEAKKVAESNNSVWQQLANMKVPLNSADQETKDIFLETVNALRKATNAPQVGVTPLTKSLEHAEKAKRDAEKAVREAEKALSRAKKAQEEAEHAEKELLAAKSQARNA